MKILIRLDLEGVSGVVSYEQIEPGRAEYAYGQRMAAGDVNAAVGGCFDGGADRVVVYDMHCHGRNVPLDQFHPRGEMIHGKPRLSRQSLEEFDGLILLGFHAKAGSGTLMAHSYEGDTLDVRVNGKSLGEIGTEAAIAGEAGVPLLMVAGDSAGCEEALALVPDVKTVEVKTSMSPTGALCPAAEKTRQLIATAAAEVTCNAGDFKPFSLGPFERLEVDLPLPTPISAERMTEAPGIRLEDGTLVITAADLYDAWHTYRWLRESPEGQPQRR